VNVFVLTMDELGALVGPRSASNADLVAASYDRHHRELFGFALRASRDRETAEDLVQEAFIRLMVEVDAGRAPENARAWLYRVVANLAVSGGRRASVARRQLGALAVGEPEAGPESAYLDHERTCHLEEVLGELGADARTALLMAAGGFTGVEIAQAIGRSANATRTMMCRARLQLRERLGSVASAS
jgi:RNA polymerase sigma-70 factor (ECF subfamily)